MSSICPHLVLLTIYYSNLGTTASYNQQTANNKSQIWVQLLTTLNKLLTLLEEHREVHFIESMPDEEENLEVGLVK